MIAPNNIEVLGVSGKYSKAKRSSRAEIDTATSTPCKISVN